MNRQIEQCTFNVITTNGTVSTALNGFPVNVKVSGGAYTYEPYFFTGSAYDEALNGQLRSQFGGVRFKATLSWERLINTEPLLDVINNYRVTNANEIIIQFHPDASNTSYFENVVVSSFVYDNRIESTIIRQPISIDLVGKEVKTSIPSFYTI
jgi:hypothetical protein